MSYETVHGYCGETIATLLNFVAPPSRLRFFLRQTRETLPKQWLESDIRNITLPVHAGLRPFAQELAGFAPVDPARQTTVSERLFSIYETSDADIIPGHAMARRVLCRLGYDSDAEFISGLVAHIGEKLVSYGVDPALFNQTLELADACYRNSDQSRRYSGEPFIFHPLRMIWYYLTRLETNRHRPPAARVNLVVLGMLVHDIDEGKRDRRCLELTESGYVLSDGQQQATLPGSLSTTIDALADETAYPDNYQQRAATVDRTGVAAEIKRFDRLDNLFTYMHKRDWKHVLMKMSETAHVAALIEWASAFSQDPGTTVINLMHMFVHGMPEDLFLFSLANGLAYRAYIHINQKLRLALEQADIPFRRSDLAAISDNLKQQRRYHIFDTDAIDQKLDLSTRLVEPYCRAFPHSQLSDFVPFGYSQLKPLISDAQDLLFNFRWISFPAYGRPYDLWVKTRFPDTIGLELFTQMKHGRAA